MCLSAYLGTNTPLDIPDDIAPGSLIALDKVVGGYVGVLPAAANGETMESIAMAGTTEVQLRLSGSESNWTLLDVRDANERAEAAIQNSRHIYVGELNERWKELDKAQSYTLMCAGGARATIAAGWLASKGFDKLDIYLGSMGAWQSAQSHPSADSDSPN
jgi:hydroxyacylglutathione hydrolase